VLSFVRELLICSSPVLCAWTTYLTPSCICFPLFFSPFPLFPVWIWCSVCYFNSSDGCPGKFTCFFN
jgi:hypothetical protein